MLIEIIMLRFIVFLCYTRPTRSQEKAAYIKYAAREKG